jgi:hypothetical protein
MTGVTARQPDIRITMAIKKQHFWIDRKHDRVITEIPCQVSPLSGSRKGATIINLAAGGLKFACTQEVFNLLLPEEQRIPGQVIDIDIDIQFQLQAAGRKKPLSIRTTARIIHTERLAQDSYTLGAQFIALHDADIRGIELYLKQVTGQANRL